MICFVLFCFVLFCFVLFCFVLFCSVQFSSVQFCSVLSCFIFFYPFDFDLFDCFMFIFIFYSILMHQKGSCVIRMLEKYLGQENFKKGLQVYLKRFNYKNAVTEVSLFFPLLSFYFYLLLFLFGCGDVWRDVYNVWWLLLKY